MSNTPATEPRLSEQHVALCRKIEAGPAGQIFTMHLTEDEISTLHELVNSDIAQFLGGRMYHAALTNLGRAALARYEADKGEGDATT